MTEQRWVIGAIAKDLVNMAAYAAAPNGWSDLPASAVDARETLGAPQGQSYSLAVQLPDAAGPIRSELKIVRSIWAPELYEPILHDLFARYGVTRPPSLDPEPDDLTDERFLTNLATPLTHQMEIANQRLSRWLEEHPLDPQAHDDAALLLGVLALRENSGQFWNPRGLCNRAVAHLAFGRALRAQPSECGEVAELLIGLMLDAKADCQQRINSLRDRLRAHPELRPWIMAATLRNTRDYRQLPNPKDGTMLENIELFRALGEAVDPDEAVRRMPNPSPNTAPDWSCVILQFAYSVGAGHRFALPSVPLELMDAEHVFPEIRDAHTPMSLAAIFNREPGGAVQTVPGQGTHWRVIDQGAWAQFFQRHLLHAADATYDFLQDKWGVPEEAKKFQTQLGSMFTSFDLYPLCLEHLGRDTRAELIPRAANLLSKRPEWIGDGAWVRVVRILALEKAGDWQAQSRAWFTPSIPTGTGYGLYWRVGGGHLLPSLGLDEAKKMYELAPGQFQAADVYLHALSARRPTPEQYEKVMGSLLDYYLPALELEARLVERDPVRYGQIMTRAAALNPALYVTLARYDVSYHLEPEAAAAYQAAFDHNADPVLLANSCAWLVDYYYNHNQSDRALAIAREAARVYSSTGLKTLADLSERMNHLAEAETNFANIKERYNDPGPLNEFYQRHASVNPEYAAKFKASEAATFPHGIQEVKLERLSGKPAHGVLVRNDNSLSRACGLKVGAVIVGIDGKLVESMDQYSIVRSMTAAPAMELLVYQDDHYQAIHAYVPGRRFNLDFVTWP